VVWLVGDAADEFIIEACDRIPGLGGRAWGPVGSWHLSEGRTVRPFG
jgi:hypothetical protein